MEIEPIVRELESGVFNDVIEPGATYILDLTLYDGNGELIDLANVVATYTCCDRFGPNNTEHFKYVSGTNPQISVNTTTGRLIVKIPAATTAAIAWKNAVYDLFLKDMGTPDQDTIRLLRGTLRVPPTSLVPDTP
jgi:hypothetical protein